ncbi:glycosyltransferase family 1 protein [Paenibacillus sp. 1011MAR3C5]|uniref:glycosyltransferase family 1 protein n=1 Tax=Paenibacillus sp. 1011MAR3C5 TaxID=1675787 RepID=UPI000E6B8EC1|nr:glycosyltransferase family 1 protein [Paenibacillus sp. 1011MAR3C5]RJE91160.1 glycosyltransferase family 1 protein [Paenibacillus sp. 1011MAR3C5]
MEPIRILQVVTIMNRGGLETMLMNYYRQMSKNGIQFDFLVHRTEEGHYDKEIISLGGSIFRMPPIKPGNYRRYFKELDAFFARHKEYKVVHAHMNENSGFAIRAAKKAGVPCRIIHSHLSDLALDYKYPFRLYARAAIRGNPSHYFACSARAGEWLYGKKPTGGQAVTVLNNAVNTEDFRFDEGTRAEVRAELNAGDSLVIGHIGRFNEQKNHKFLLDIFESLHRRRKDALLVLAGDGYLRPAIEREAERRGLSQSIRFLGVREDVARLLQGMDLFLFPSLFEGLPVVLVEAQAAGLTCIVSDRITKETDVTNRVTFLSLDQSPDEWSSAILSASYEHADTRAMLRERGYDAAAMAEWLGAFYRQQLETAAASSQ